MDRNEPFSAQRRKDKIHVLRSTTSWPRGHLFPPDDLAVGPVQIASADADRDLGVSLDSNMSTRSHVNRLVGGHVLRHPSADSQHSTIPRSTLATLIFSFIMSKLDYCNFAPAGLPRCDVDRLQSVINAAARLTVGA